MFKICYEIITVIITEQANVIINWIIVTPFFIGAELKSSDKNKISHLFVKKNITNKETNLSIRIIINRITMRFWSWFNSTVLNFLHTLLMFFAYQMIIISIMGIESFPTNFTVMSRLIFIQSSLSICSLLNNSFGEFFSCYWW